MSIGSNLVSLDIEKNVGGGTFGFGAADLFNPGIIAVVPFSGTQVLNLSYIVASIQSPAVMGNPVELILSVVFTLVIYNIKREIIAFLLELGAKSLKFAVSGIFTLVLIFSRLIAEL
jgi:hypothetical protein